jgi:hypothetical protein
MLSVKSSLAHTQGPEEDYRTDQSGDQITDEPGQFYPQLSENKSTNGGANNAYNQTSHYTTAATADEFACDPSGYETDKEKQQIIRYKRFHFYPAPIDAE